MRLFQVAGIVMAAAGVALLAIASREIPYLALALAFTFGFYGLLRKLVHVDGVTSLLIETALMGPPALVLLTQRVSPVSLTCTYTCWWNPSPYGRLYATASKAM